MARYKGSHPPKEKPPGSPRTFSTVPYPRTCSLRAKRRPPLSLSFFHSAYFVCFVPKRVGGQSQVVRMPAFLPHLTKGNGLSFRVYGWIQSIPPNLPPVPPHTFSSKLSSPGPSLCLFPLCPSSPWTRAGRLGRERKKSQRSLRSFFQCNTGKRPLLFVIPAASRGFFVFHALPIMFFPLRKKTDVHTIPNPP